MDDMILPVDAFVRSVCGNRIVPHAFFLGAGASISSGVPSASACLWEWKRDIFLTNHPHLEEHTREISLERVRQRVQVWLDAQGVYPAADGDDEYSYYAEACHPLADNRRQYFESLSAHAVPRTGYQLLALLVKARTVGSVWTTNFDGLAPKAAILAGVTPVEVTPGTTDRLNVPVTPGSMLHVALHGDFRYDSLRNTGDELRQSNDALQAALVEHLHRQSLVVLGYSGRDKSVMDSLAQAYSRRGTGNLFWCGIEGDAPPENVIALLKLARAQGRGAWYVPTAGFDDVLIRLASHGLTGTDLEAAREIRRRAAADHAGDSTPFRIRHQHVAGIIKSNAFALECPGEVLQLECDAFSGKGAWRALKDRTQDSSVVAVPLKGKVFALGLVDDVHDLFADELKGTIERTPISGHELGMEDGTIVNLLTQALVRAIAAKRGLECDGRNRLWVSEPGERHNILGHSCQVVEAVNVAIRRYSGSMFMVLKPTIRVTTAGGDRVAADLEKEAKRQILGKQYNRAFNAALNRWIERVFPHGSDDFDFPHGQASTFRFRARKVPAQARILQPQARGAIALPPQLAKHVKHDGVVYPEPDLVFARPGGERVFDSHPIRGIIEHRPFDYAVTAGGMGSEVRVAVVCPAQDRRALSEFLWRLTQRRDPEGKQEYLLPYPGFESAFGLPLNLPDTRTGLWYDIRDPAPDAGIREGAAYLRQSIQDGVAALLATGRPHLIVVFIPSRWKRWESYDLDGESFDLHDFIKAHCVTKGVASQFLREATLGKRYQCEVMWWLALACYVKADRTPWILKGLDDDTAFAGLGFSLDPTANRGRRILIGCSHIYDSRGLGLTYRLSRLENGVLRGDNPFMSRDDARRMGELTRQLFWDAHGRLPKRAVVHRRTPFRNDEVEGLLEGLHGVGQVDLLQITEEPVLRYIAAVHRGGGHFVDDPYPVRRGSAVVLDARRALLWVHGVADPVEKGRKPYYQGKSRIPAPLVISRHHGQTDLDVLAAEVLGLSKMGLNSFDLYTKVPATIASSNTIARIGRLLDRFAPGAYDYRLFI